MRLGVALRSMGPQATRETIVACARAAESAGLDDVWVQDHIAIPPDDAEGSEGRYLDPLATLAYLAAATPRIGLGSGVLNPPLSDRRCRPPSGSPPSRSSRGGASCSGIGIGWMKAEFRALGVPRAQRGRISDETLEFLQRCFADDVVESNGQEFLFRPRPRAPSHLRGRRGAPRARAGGALRGRLDAHGRRSRFTPGSRSRICTSSPGNPGAGRPRWCCSRRSTCASPPRRRISVAALAEVGVTSLGSRYTAQASSRCPTRSKDAGDRARGGPPPWRAARGARRSRGARRRSLPRPDPLARRDARAAAPVCR